MKSFLALTFVSITCFAQPKLQLSVDTVQDLIAKYPTTDETISVVNRKGGTNFGPLQFWRYAPASSASTNAAVLSAINGGRWILLDLASRVEVIQTVNQARIFIPKSENLAIEYVLTYDTSAPTQAIWRISNAFVNTKTGKYTYSRSFFGGNAICDEGAWEFAVKVSTDGGYVGTYHGYDIASAAYLMADNMRLSNTVANTSCDQFSLVQRSTVYREAATNILAYKTTRLDFSLTGVKCKQRVEWNDTVTLDHAYLGMMPIEREIGGYQITDTGFVDPVLSVQNISSNSFPLVISSTGNYIMLWSEASGISARMEMLSWPTATHNAWISDSIYYNKLYFDTPSASVTPATVWESEWEANINIIN